MAELNNQLKNFFSINRKLHIYLGLFITLFIWLFFVSGLIMNHGNWKATKFYEKRIETKTDFNLSPSILKDNSEVVNSIKNQLNLTGEVSNIKIKKGNIGFRVLSPGIVQEVSVDTIGKGTLKIMKYNFWGKLHTLHLFNGMNKNDPAQQPTWIVTKLWRLMMDITAIILIILGLGSWLMWYKVRKDYKAGYLFLLIGIAISVYYLFLIDFIGTL